MVEQSEYPDSWARDCDDKEIRVEIALPTIDAGDIESFDFIEIPTSKVEVWERKSNGPHIVKSAKVVFPTSWDGADVRELVKGYGVSAPTYARVSVKDDSGVWVLDHFGIIAGVGGTDNELESKCWIYDLSYVFDALGVTETYNRPTARQVLSDVANKLQSNLVPLTGVAVLAPNSERVFLRSVPQLNQDTAAVRRGSSYYGYDVSEEDNELGDATVSDIDVGTSVSVPNLPFADLAAIGSDIANPFEFADRVIAETFDTEGPLDRFTNAVGDFVYRNTPLGNKKFVRNHDTVGDVMNWLSNKTGLQYHFEPTQNGAVLVITGGPMRRTFVQDSVVTDLQRGTIQPTDFQSQTDEYYAHETAVVRNNQALYEIAPANQIILKGDTQRSVLGKEVDLSFDTSQIITERDYPVATATATNLVDAAGGAELPLEVESDATTVTEARQEAIATLQRHLDQTSEGNITLGGLPRALPYDVLDAYETCNDYVTEQIPVRYEIDTVKHTAGMMQSLETKLNVQAFVGEESIDVETRIERAD
jgi:hypothetical protein